HRVLKFDSLVVTSALAALFVSSLFDKNSAHRLRGRAEEVTTTVPVLNLAVAEESYVNLVYQCRGLKRVPGLLVGHLFRGHSAKLVLNQPKQFFDSLFIASLNIREDQGYIAHCGCPQSTV